MCLAPTGQRVRSEFLCSTVLTQPEVPLPPHPHRYVTHCSFSPDGSYLTSASNDKIVKLWQLQAGDTERKTFPRLDGTCTALVLAPPTL